MDHVCLDQLIDLVSERIRYYVQTYYELNVKDILLQITMGLDVTLRDPFGSVDDIQAELDRVAARVNAELCKLLTGQNIGDILRQYPDVFCRFWPELGPLTVLRQNNPQHLNS